MVRALAIVTFSLTTLGAAATLGGVGTSPLAAGGGTVARCDGDGFTPSYTTAAGRVTAVTVGGIADPGCDDGALSVELTAGGTGVGGGGPASVPADADTLSASVTVPISPQPLAHEVDGFNATVVGP